MTLPPLSILFFALAILCAGMSATNFQKAIEHPGLINVFGFLAILSAISGGLMLWIGLTLTP